MGEDMSIKPVLGLLERRIYDSMRFDNLKKAMYRYGLYNKEIPLEWVEEYNELAVRYEGVFKTEVMD